jgi:hypothetical protein
VRVLSLSCSSASFWFVLPFSLRSNPWGSVSRFLTIKVVAKWNPR